MKWMSVSTKRQFDRALIRPAEAATAGGGAAARSRCRGREVGRLSTPPTELGSVAAPRRGAPRLRPATTALVESCNLQFPNRHAEAAAATGGSNQQIVQAQMGIATLQLKVPADPRAFARSCARARGPWQVAQNRLEYLDRAAPSGIRVRHTVSAAIEAETKVCPNPEHTLNHNS
jgi:hypothetical protein